MNQIQLEAEQDAGDALRDYGVRDLADLPVDATRIAEFYRANVFADDLTDEDLDGFVLIYPWENRAEITLNSTQSLNRRRFTCAHELGHFWQARKSNIATEVGFVDEEGTVVEEHRDGRASLGTSIKEQYANAFAAALLMPAKFVKQLHRAGESPDDMARMFRVSRQAMAYRLANLNLG